MTAIGVFVKYPEPGRVKTRLAESIGPEKAASLYARMLDEVFSTLDMLDPTAFRVHLLYDTFRGETEYRKLARQRPWAYQPQSAGDLGDRIAAAAKQLVRSEGRALLIGTDCIDLAPRHFEESTTLLQGGVDVVLGPAKDGGYYLVGMNRFCAELFKGIEWSTERVLRQTLEKAERQSLRTTQLEVLGDIDTIEDLRASRLCGDY